jgi:hypothetical protein
MSTIENIHAAGGRRRCPCGSAGATASIVISQCHFLVAPVHALLATVHARTFTRMQCRRVQFSDLSAPRSIREACWSVQVVRTQRHPTCGNLKQHGRACHAMRAMQCCLASLAMLHGAPKVRFTSPLSLLTHLVSLLHSLCIPRKQRCPFR